MIEKKASGQSLIQDMRRAGLPVLEYLPDRDKVIARVLEELLRFQTHDQVDAPMIEAWHLGRVWIPMKKVIENGQKIY